MRVMISAPCAPCFDYYYIPRLAALSQIHMPFCMAGGAGICMQKWVRIFCFFFLQRNAK